LTSSPVGTPKRIILVVDTGVDDALALALAVRHPSIQLEAVLTSCGNVGLELATANTLRVLDWLGATDVPVLAGAACPLEAPLLDAAYWHGTDGLGGARLPVSTRAAGDDAVGYLLERVAREPGTITVVCTGPLTNLALAVQRSPEIVQHVAEVVLMGGAVGMPGNTTPTAAYNIYADPEAAAVVFDQDWPLTMVGLDVTRHVLITADEVNQLAALQTPEAILIKEVTRDLFITRRMAAMALHDPVAVGVALDPSLVTTLSGPVRVETRGEFTRGQTVFDLRTRAAPADVRTRVCMEVDAERFRTLFFSTLGLVGGTAR
jgi:inosine-uridine nucleoside N-ribohydrolase